MAAIKAASCCRSPLLGKFLRSHKRRKNCFRAALEKQQGLYNGIYCRTLGKTGMCSLISLLGCRVATLFNCKCDRTPTKHFIRKLLWCLIISSNIQFSQLNISIKYICCLWANVEWRILFDSWVGFIFQLRITKKQMLRNPFLACLMHSD